MNIITYETKIGTISIDITRRKIVSYAIKDNGYGDLYYGVIFYCNINNNGCIKRGWTFTTEINFDVNNIDDILMNSKNFIAWDDQGIRII